MSTVLAPEDLAIDHALADISAAFRLLLDVTPVNVDAARERFREGDDEPAFEYRPLEDDTAVLHAELGKVDVESVNDATVAHLATAKRRELDLQIEMLAARCTPDFRALSIELYGTVAPALLSFAEDVLAMNEPPQAGSSNQGACVDAEALARLAEAELDRYRAFEPDLSAHVEIRADCTGVMVTCADLLIGPSAQVPESRAEALLHHEIGTHVLTYVNGTHQPLHLLAAGLAGYEETQEALALLAEHLSGGLTLQRLRQIAARVVAVHRMVEGASFREVHDAIVDLGFSSAGAFGIAMRVFRSGGFTKDLVYLRGLVDLVEHVAAGHSLDVLWLGKMALADVSLIEDLWRRGALTDPLLRPRYLDQPGVDGRLDALRHAGSILDLVET